MTTSAAAAATALSIFSSSEPLAGQRATESAHRRIELQSRADLSYLVGKVSAAAREKIEKRLGAEGGGEGEGEKDGESRAKRRKVVRERVEGLVDEYIRETFSAAKDSLSINGVDSAELEAELEKAQQGEELEPFDSKLAQRIQTLSTQIEHHTLELANLRRKAPRETAEAFTLAFEKASREYDAQVERAQKEGLEAAQATRVDAGSLERVDEVESTWQKGVGDLASLNSGLPGTVAKLEKAQRAVGVTEER